jgi:ABC-type branched-subunit amino acid transport system ATPase component
MSSVVSAIIRDVARDRAVLMVEHNLSVVANICQQVTVLQRGEILAEGDYADGQRRSAGSPGLYGNGGRLMTTLLEVQGLNAWYGESHVLHGVDMRVAEGETITILGRNGVGKTTTLRTITGIVRARKGKISFGGKDMMQVPLHKTAHKGIGFVPEERGIFSTLTVSENLLLPPSWLRAA